MKRITIAVICHQGIGSSIWLKSLISKLLAQHGVPVRIFQSDLNSLFLEDVDIVVGMNYLQKGLEDIGRSQIFINNILDEELNNKLLNNPIIKNYLKMN